VDLHDLTWPPAPDTGRWCATTGEGALRVGRTWLLSDAMRSLTRALGGPVAEDARRDLPELLRWSSRTLDTRCGNERHCAPAAGFTQTQIAALIEAAGPLGLLTTPPPGLPGYDITVILGGTVTGNELRTRLARDLAAQGAQLGTLVALTADRPLTSAEGPLTRYRTEAEHLAATISAAFGTTAKPAGSGDGSHAQTSQDSRPVIQAVIARPSRPGQRADTSDAVHELTRRIPPSDRQRVLAITSAIYVPYQFLVIATALLANGSGYFEIAGTPTATDGQPALLAQCVAQEIHAAITALVARVDLASQSYRA
jgi:hypothetical protein